MKSITYKSTHARYKILFALSLVMSLSAFRHTDVQGYTDPEYIGYKFKNVVLHMPNATIDFERRVTKLLSKRLGKSGVRIFLREELFPPTREWDEEKTAQVYRRLNIDSGIVITVGATETKVTPGMVTFNSTTYGGTTTGRINQMKFIRDSASFQIAIVDTETANTVWIGELDTRGAGLLFVGNKSTAKGLVKHLTKEWKAAGHMR